MRKSENIDMIMCLENVISKNYTDYNYTGIIVDGERQYSNFSKFIFTSPYDNDDITDANIVTLGQTAYIKVDVYQ